MLLTIATPAYNEAPNLAPLYERIRDTLDAAGIDWEWIVVDDHSTDATFEAVQAIAEKDARVRGLRLSRNFGSHGALLCGFSHARGDAAVCLVGDGQSRPEFLPEMVEAWKGGAQVIWAERRNRAKADKASVRLWAGLYYRLVRRIGGVPDLPPTDYVLLDRVVLDALTASSERNMSILALVSWMGFRQENLACDYSPRLHGTTKWTLSKRLKVALDSIISFSYLPIRMMALLGGLVATAGLIYSLVIIANAVLGNPAEGWSELMVVVLVLGGVQMLMLSALGEYLWRALEESRGRPRFLVENATPPKQEKGDEA